MTRRREKATQKGDVMAAEVKTCMECGKPLADRVEEVERTGTGVSRSTGECSTYRVWFCVNPECVLFKTDILREQLADRTDR